MLPDLPLPAAAAPLLAAFSVAFSRPTFHRFLALMVGAVLARGRRTVTACLRAAGTLAAGETSGYHRLFSAASWSLRPLAHALAAAALEFVPADRPVVVTVDDTTAVHKGRRVYGKGRHHDACRSTRSHTVWVWGHRWVVLAVNARFPFAPSRAWALPVLAALYKTAELNGREGRRHRTAIDLARPLVAALVRWFPDRRFVLLGDGGYASHALAAFCHRHRRRLTLVSRLSPRARLYDPPPPRRPGTKGRPRVRGERLPAPADAVAATPADRRASAEVSWYGGGRRDVELVTGVGHWYHGGGGLVPLRWVFVRDASGTHRDQYFYATDPALTAGDVVSLYTGRWSVEVTFQEAKHHLGLGTTRQRVEASVTRAFPCLLGLFTVVSLTYARDAAAVGGDAPVASDPWYEKVEPTFADALARVRRLFWTGTVLARQGFDGAFSKLPGELREVLLYQLTRAA